MVYYGVLVARGWLFVVLFGRAGSDLVGCLNDSALETSRQFGGMESLCPGSRIEAKWALGCSGGDLLQWNWERNQMERNQMGRIGFPDPAFAMVSAFLIELPRLGGTSHSGI